MVAETLKPPSEDFSRLPPNDQDAEVAAIGSMLLCGDDRPTFDAIRQILRTPMFYGSDHGVFFDAICRLADKGSSIDAVILRAELARAGLLEGCGGAAYLAKILSSVPSAAHGPHYAKIVREKYIWREMIRVANGVIRRAWEPGRADRSQEVAKGFLDDLAGIAHIGAVEKIHTIEEVVMDYFSDHERGKSQRVSTGLLSLDGMITGGVPLGKFTMIGGRPAMGKSQLLKQIVLNAATADFNCGIVTVEENREKIVQNYLANVSGIENNRIVSGNMSEPEWNELLEAMPKLIRKKIFISDEPTKLQEIEGVIMTMATTHKCQLVAVDYLQLIDGGNLENENREITAISKTLKGVFKRCGIAGIAAVQLNRGNEAQGIRRPTLRDLRGSGSLEQDGDLIILLHREDYYHKNEPDYVPTNQLEAIVAKNKDGPTGVVPLLFSGKYQRVTDWTPTTPFDDCSPDGV